jgi:hypothetical protein
MRSTLGTAESAAIALSPPSKVTIARFLHPEKQDVRRCLIDEGIQIEASDEQEEKAVSCTVEIRESLSNMMLERFAHFEKQASEIVSIDRGTQIKVNDEHEETADLPRIDN